MPALRLHRLTRRFPGAAVAALAGLDLEIAEGEFVSVTGPSGSGKTTLLRLVAGLDSPDSGSIGFGDDGSWHKRSPAERNVAMVGQQPALLPQLTVAENLGLSLKLRKVGVAETSERVRTMAARLGLESLLDRLPASLSGGEQQRVSLGRALIQRPSLLLLDEPLSQLDAPLRLELRREIARLSRELRVTTLHVTHDQAEALELGDRIAVLCGGKLEQVGSPREILRRPANRFVARFFSPDGCNELVGMFQVKDGVATFHSRGRSFPVGPAKAKSILPETMEAICLLRPEASHVSGPAELTGSVSRAWLSGAGWRAEVETDMGPWLLHAPSGEIPALGTVLAVCPLWADALWFNAADGARLE